MSLSSKGCVARAKLIRNIENKGIVAEITTFKRKTYKGESKYIPDFRAEVLFYDKGEQINTGDYVTINSFYVRNCNERFINSTRSSFVITEWTIFRRNPYIKKFYGKSKEERDEIAMRQRQVIEKEIEAEEQDLDEYIENNGEDDMPF